MSVKGRQQYHKALKVRLKWRTKQSLLHVHNARLLWIFIKISSFLIGSNSKPMGKVQHIFESLRPRCKLTHGINGLFIMFILTQGHVCSLQRCWNLWITEHYFDGGAISAPTPLCSLQLISQLATLEWCTMHIFNSLKCGMIQEWQK